METYFTNASKLGLKIFVLLDPAMSSYASEEEVWKLPEQDFTWDVTSELALYQVNNYTRYIIQVISYFTIFGPPPLLSILYMLIFNTWIKWVI